MLARPALELPAGDYLYEPKWDGFRCRAFVRGGAVDLRSRHDRRLARYFPEVAFDLLSAGGLDLRARRLAERRAALERLLGDGLSTVSCLGARDHLVLTPATTDLGAARRWLESGVVEVGYDQLDAARLRHPARFIRWRPDRDARSCTFDQLSVATFPLGDILRDSAA